MLKRSLDKARHLQSFIVTLSIFLAGFFIGYYISEIRMREMVSSYDIIATKIDGILLQTKILEEDLCGYNILEMNREKVEIGKQVEEIEAIRGKRDKEVLRLVEKYSLFSINHLLLVEKWKRECKGNVSILIFFYSNLENTTESEKQGYVLNNIYLKHPEKIVIYAFDVDIDNPAINALKRKYNITSAPTLVINGKVYPGFQSKEKIEGLIKL